MVKLESRSNRKPISFGQSQTSLLLTSVGFRPRPPPFEIQQVPSRVIESLPLPPSLRPDAPVETSAASRNLRGLVGISVALLIIFLLR